MSQGLAPTHLARFPMAWSDRYESVLDSFEQDYWRETVEVSFRSLGDMAYTEDTGANQPSLLDVTQRVLSVAEATKRFIAASSAREVPLSLRTLKGRLDRCLSDLNALVPYPNLTDRPRDLIAGFELFLRELRKPVNPLVTPYLVHIMSAH